VPQTFTKEAIVPVVLEYFSTLLRNRADNNQSVMLPVEMYVEMCDRPKFTSSSKVLAKWRITREEITSLSLSSPAPDEQVIGAGFYRCARGDFSVYNMQLVCIDWHLSPTAGRGFWYQPGVDESGKLVLKRIKPTPG
jgi:hypothetical protein